MRKHPKNKKHPRSGVVICGAYGLDNAGDDAVLEAIIGALRRLDGQMPITVMARQPKKIAARYHITAVHPLRLCRWYRAMRRSKLFLSGGGSLLQNVTSQRSLWYYLGAIRLAKKAGCAVQLYGCGIGPLTGDQARERTAKVLNDCADVVTVRDPDSLALLQELGATEPRLLLSADPALSTAPASSPRGPRIGFILRSWPSFWHHVPEVAAAARYAYETYKLVPTFFCLAPGDKTAVQSVRTELEDIPTAVSIDVRRASCMSIVVSMRLHGLLFALRDGIPAGGISYDPKVGAFCQDAALPCLDLDDLTEEGLCQLIDEVVHLDGEKLSATAKILKEREQVNIRAAAQLLAEDPDR